MIFLIIPLSFFLLAILLVIAVVLKRNMHLWLPDYLFGDWRNRRNISNGLQHIVFCFVDHFEPHHGGVNDERAAERMKIWLEQYPVLANQFEDADGFPLRHTWFYPYDELCENELKQLSKLCKDGYGEVEFHLHHKNDTSESLTEKINSGLAVFNKYGIGIAGDQKKTYAFIHGNWALDNSIIHNGENFCGVNDEISVLKKTGCYADFTFPAYLEKSQPALVNTIFYAKDDPQKPKSHKTGIPVKKNGINRQGDLLLIQGPMMLNWKRRKYGLIPNVEDGNIHEGNHFHPSKVDLWIKAGIRVRGNNDWIFVKVFTHGAPEKNHEVVLGEDANKLFSYLVKNYNDGKKYAIHFTTAREMYNIIKAAEEGKTGDPNNFRNYKIQPYKNTGSNIS